MEEHFLPPFHGVWPEARIGEIKLQLSVVTIRAEITGNK